MMVMMLLPTTAKQTTNDTVVAYANQPLEWSRIVEVVQLVEDLPSFQLVAAVLP